MKKKLFLLFLMVLPVAIVFAQPTIQPKTEQEIKSMLCHKWKLITMQAGGEQKNTMPPEGNLYMLFKSDGTFIDISDGKEEPGKWIYDHKTMTLKTGDIKATEPHTIVKITTTDLIIKSGSESSTVTMTLKRVD